MLTKFEFHRLWMKIVRSWIKLSAHKQLCAELICHLKRAS